MSMVRKKTNRQINYKKAQHQQTRAPQNAPSREEEHPYIAQEERGKD
jgi:hypothetical protein